MVADKNAPGFITNESTIFVFDVFIMYGVAVVLT